MFAYELIVIGAMLVWDEDGLGHELTGRLVRLQEAAVLDGLAEIEQQVHSQRQR